MIMMQNKMKALTFSYDDGVTQDIRLIELFNKYGMKATFNLNSGLLGRAGMLVREGVDVSHNKIKSEDVKYVYEGHEVAGHTLTHPRLPGIDNQDEIIRQVEGDRLRLSELCGYEVVGFAYPCGGVNCDDRVADIIRKHTGIRYGRTILSNHSFEKQADLYQFQPTVYHHGDWDSMIKLGEQFLDLQPDTPSVMYIWGHAYEFDINNSWDRFEEFLKMMSGRSDIFYGTNKEVLL